MVLFPVGEQRLLVRFSCVPWGYCLREQLRQLGEARRHATRLVPGYDAANGLDADQMLLAGVGHIGAFYPRCGSRKIAVMFKPP